MQTWKENVVEPYIEKWSAKNYSITDNNEKYEFQITDIGKAKSYLLKIDLMHFEYLIKIANSKENTTKDYAYFKSIFYNFKGDISNPNEDLGIEFKMSVVGQDEIT